VRRGEVYWADVNSSAGRRPVVVLSRSGAIPVLSRVTVVLVTRTIRDIASEVRVGRREGLPAESVVSCDNLATIRKAVLDEMPIGRLSLGKLVELDRALRFALGIRA